MDQKKNVDLYRQKEEPEQFEKDMKERLERIKDMKKAITSQVSPKEFVLREDWQGMTESRKRAYESGNMYWTGTIEAAINVPKGETVVSIQAKGSQAYDIWPYMVVELDGEEVGEMFVNSPAWKEYSFKVNTDGGIKVLSITFANDGGNKESGEDRNLYIGEAKVVKDSIK